MSIPYIHVWLLIEESTASKHITRNYILFQHAVYIHMYKVKSHMCSPVNRHICMDIILVDYI